ncbi:hypothetical protein BEWA_023000 [Theileria equi strain WA]|uniref:Uncharacterized protein n=1 Tax=Theileria equi strain WA TaxID=1537102 RepID=L0AV22_THEEQ|nr:hypothetical protein BEWA_023000 [Theileria equi strain WA]AFZ79452.1 hypothetical protein BEWA_023000 [Theileria equi strain WA]|eukprot:XP_004829118.1 hypothetical protein BEWA_023000 [Theileria equi strain WA]
MYSHVRDRRIYGDVLPPSIEIKRDTNQLARVFCRQYRKVTRIDVLDKLPENYPQYCRERSAIKEIVFADDILATVYSACCSRYSPTEQDRELPAHLTWLFQDLHGKRAVWKF